MVVSCELVTLIAHWSMGEDYRLASEKNWVAVEVNNVVIEKDRFLEELDSLGVRHVPTKMAEFLRDRQRIRKQLKSCGVWRGKWS
uniref:Uncharacterized protein n=1 Tax=Tanacetum cinerariifolium TaxID=118510 RepID=A0A699H1A1_TANCI|nr:hypothetical protein [Tanacetum cinerariifolium]